MRWIGSSAVDLAAAVLLAGPAAAGSVLAGQVGRSPGPVDAPALVLVVVAVLGLAVRRSRPLVALAVAALSTGGYLALGYAYGPVLLVFMIAVYSAARHAPARAAAWSAAAALVPLLVHLVTADHSLGWLGVAPVVAWVAVPFALGYARRLRHEAAGRARAEVLRQRVDDERLRVAQEVHDIVGHGLAAIKMRADIALHVMDGSSGPAREALAAISQTSGQALEELRATLAAVRRADGEDRSPAAGLDRLDDLRHRMAGAGVAVQVRTEGERVAALPAAVDLAGYRILQESLTNVLRHGGCGQADVTVRYTATSVTVTVGNPISGPAGFGSGSGIAGMRARVEALGGEFTAGPAGRRFEVCARLPTGGGS